MDESLSSFELTDSTFTLGTDSSESSSHKSSSDNSEPLTELDFPSSSGSTKSDEEFDNNLPPTVTLLKNEKTGAKVYLVGTVHFSRESQEDVAKVIQQVRPHVVVLELCSSRRHILLLDEEKVQESAKNIDMSNIISTIRSGGVHNGIMYLLLLNMTARITRDLGMAPGGEFRRAYNEASKIPKCIVQLGDRPIEITIKRALSKLSWYQSIRLALHLLMSKEHITPEEIEKCKDRDWLEQLLTELADDYPVLRRVFLDERNIFLTNSLQVAALNKVKPGNRKGPEETTNEPIKVVGVVGIGHVTGIVELWPYSQREHIKEILSVPPPSLSSKVIKYTFKISVFTLGGFLVYKFVPVPKFLRENAQYVVHKIIDGVKSGGEFKYVNLLRSTSA